MHLLAQHLYVFIFFLLMWESPLSRIFKRSMSHDQAKNSSGCFTKSQSLRLNKRRLRNANYIYCIKTLNRAIKVRMTSNLLMNLEYVIRFVCDALALFSLSEWECVRTCLSVSGLPEAQIRSEINAHQQHFSPPKSF